MKKEKIIAIIVNGREFKIEKRKVDFEEIVTLGFDEYKADENIVYTVSYSKGEDKKPKGQLVKGDKIMVKEGMIFNVSRTNKS